MITYRRGYKYQLATSHQCVLGTWARNCNFGTRFLKLTRGGEVGVIRILPGYAWDGPSGPTIDTRNFLRPSLVHDALYQLIRDGHLLPECRKHADRLLRKHCRENGMSWLRAQWVYLAVRWFGAGAAKPGGGRPMETAP